MLAPGNYVQWKSRIKRYIDTKPNNELIHYCLQNPLTYSRTEKTVPVVKVSSENNYKKIILTGIDNDIYSTVDACPNACEMWKAIERLKQGESINVQDLETNLYWEFRKFTSRDGESLESYYSRFYKMMNELIRVKTSPYHHNFYDILKQPIMKSMKLEAERLKSQQSTKNRGKAIVTSSAPIMTRTCSDR
ncbi:hypothetical protein Tco_0837164 [Tanacetum coccineum]